MKIISIIYTAKALQKELENSEAAAGMKINGKKVLDVAFKKLWDSLGLTRKFQKYRLMMSAVFFISQRYNVESMTNYNDNHRRLTKIKQSEKELRYVLDNVDQKFRRKDNRLKGKMFLADVLLKAVAIVRNEYETQFLHYPFMKTLEYARINRNTSVNLTPVRRSGFNRISTPRFNSGSLNDSGYSSPQQTVDTLDYSPIDFLHSHSSISPSLSVTNSSFGQFETCQSISGCSELSYEYKTFNLPEVTNQQQLEENSFNFIR